MELNVRGHLDRYDVAGLLLRYWWVIVALWTVASAWLACWLAEGTAGAYQS
jgi:hypothetical protein